MNPIHAKNCRAIIAGEMKDTGGFTLSEIAAILLVGTKEKARQLVARRDWLQRQPIEKVFKLTGCGKGGAK